MSRVINLSSAVLLLFVVCSTLVSASDVVYILKSEGNDPIVNVSVYLYNSTNELIGNGSTNDAGNLTMTVDAIDTTGMTCSGVIPSSNYHAVISTVNVPSKVFLNDVLSGQVRLINTLGQALEAQDCSVVTFENDTNRLIKDYRTLCFAGEPYVDPVSGNWVSYSKCPFTDSNGNYYFNTIITEEDGYQAGRYYALQFTCNGKTNSSIFYVDVMKPPDVDMVIDFIVRYLGLVIVVIFVAIIALVALLAVTGVAWWVLKKVLRR
jgi:hypothetical protein